VNLDYISEINAFHKVYRARKDFSFLEVTLWHVLIQHFNEDFWPDTVELKTDELATMTRMSKKSVERARDKLKDAGLIKVIHRRGRQSPIYSIVRHTDAQPDAQTPVVRPVEGHTDAQPDAQAKQYSKTKDIRQCSQSSSQSEDVSIDAREENFASPAGCGKLGGKPVDVPGGTDRVPGEAESKRLMMELPEGERLRFEDTARNEFKELMRREPRRQDILAMFGCIWWWRRRQDLPFAYDLNEHDCLQIAIEACALKEEAKELKSFPAYIRGIYKTWVQRQTFTREKIDENQKRHDGSGIGYYSW